LPNTALALGALGIDDSRVAGFDLVLQLRQLREHRARRSGQREILVPPGEGADTERFDWLRVVDVTDRRCKPLGCV
jgi:hypothetical protein